MFQRLIIFYEISRRRGREEGKRGERQREKGGERERETERESEREKERDVEDGDRGSETEEDDIESEIYRQT